MSQFNKENSPSWGITAGTLLLAASSFMGCTVQRELDIPYETQLTKQTLLINPLEEQAATQARSSIAQNLTNQPIVNQLTRMENALGLLRANCNEYGWQGSAQIREDILNEFIKTERDILLAFKKDDSLDLHRSLERIYESLSIAHSLFKDNRLATGYLTGKDATNGTMNILYGAQAQIKLARIQLTESQ